MSPSELPRRLHGDAASHASLTLLTWNVLADALAFGNFIRAPEACLEWSSRGERIVAELTRGLTEPADVLCLQEVDQHAFLVERLRRLGYVDAHAPKAEGRDGCSLFVRRDRFTLEEVETLRYRDERGDAMTQLALLAKLVPVDGGPPLRVATTHLKAKSGFEDIRGRQAAQLVERCRAFDEPVVIAGDFNDVPGSPAYAAMRAAFGSAYAAVLGAEPTWTTWKIRAKGEKKAAIDFVWHSGGLKPLACLAVPADADVEDGRLPSWQYPSDHLSLAARFTRG